MRLTLLLFSILFASIAFAIPSDHGVDYDIIYVRYVPVDPDTGSWVRIPQGETAYDITGNADLMRLKPDGTQEVMVDCDTTCAVMDPYISYDGNTVYYSKIIDIDTATQSDKGDTAGYIYKIDLTTGSPYTEVQLTYPESFGDVKYAGNTEAADSFSSLRKIRDMAPVPLSDGRLLFTSNRAGLVDHRVGTGTFNTINLAKNSVQQIYVMDDHDGTANTTELANIKRIDNGTMSMAQHPMQLKDGRILFTLWNSFGPKFGYAFSTLFTMYPDGSNLQQFTEPHDHAKNVDHFITQIANEDVVYGWYYPSYDFGFGVLVKTDSTSHNGDFTRQAFTQLDPGGVINFSERRFDRPNTSVITPHTSPRDLPAPNQSGKYAMPSWAKNGHMLTAYSAGYVNHFSSACDVGIDCENLKSGIYLLKNVATVPVTDPTNTAQLAPMIDDANYNEIWPRAVVPYNDVFGQAAPDIIPSTRTTATSKYLAKGEAAALVGTSSMLNKEEKTINKSGDEIFVFDNSRGRESHAGEWMIQGTSSTEYSDSDVYAVRILSIPELPFTNTISIDDPGVYVADSRVDYTPARFTSAHHESWEILGEFPLTHKATTDAQGNPDTSWWAKIPSDTPTTIQALDINGMMLYSETTWRSMAAGEQRTDCGGCHAHSTEKTQLDFDTTQAGSGALISGVTGVSTTDPLVEFGFWDLTLDGTPVLTETGGVEILSTKSWDVEYNRDIAPIISSRCSTCHTTGQSNGGFITDGSDGSNLYEDLAKIIGDEKFTYTSPQVSKYIRSPSARASLFVWVAWDQRLDGRTNSDLADDYDYPTSHPVLNLPFDERRLIARWVDLGLPINFPTTDGFGYTDDNQLPVIEIFSPQKGFAAANQKIRFGVTDAQSDINWSSLSITYYDVSTPGTVLTVSTFNRDDNGVVTAAMPAFTVGNEYVIKVQIEDSVGNEQIQSQRFTAQAAVVSPSQVSNIGVSTQ